MSAVAQRAGVQRQTLYRHFPNEEALLGACSAMFWEHAPPPDAGAWRSIADPAERLSAGLEATYGYFEQAAPMLAGIERDRESIPGVESHMAPFDAFHERALDVLSAGWGLAVRAPGWCARRSPTRSRSRRGPRWCATAARRARRPWSSCGRWSRRLLPARWPAPGPSRRGSGS
jgi:AcrR family transcriptional regulator